MHRKGWLILLALVGCDDHLFDHDVEGSYEPTWEGVLLSMDDFGCMGCHNTQVPLLPDAILGDLEQGNEIYVVPFSPEESTLWQVLIFADGYTGMPLGDQLPAADIAHFEEWILAGAPLD